MRRTAAGHGRPRAPNKLGEETYTCIRVAVVVRSTSDAVAFALLIIATFVIVLDGAAAASASSRAPGVTFTSGIASGEVTPISAILWTRTSGNANVTVEVAELGFRTSGYLQDIAAQAANDFIVKTLVAPLVPNTSYAYRFRAGSTVSDVGTFKTAPSPGAAQTFTSSGRPTPTARACMSGAPAFNNFETLAAARAESPDFFVYLGDTIYGDSFYRLAPATTLSDYRAAYGVNRDYSNLRNLLSSTSTYAQWDDHEVYDNFAGQNGRSRSIRGGARGVSRLYADVRAATATRCDLCGLANVPRIQVGSGGRPVHSRRAIVSQPAGG